MAKTIKELLEETTRLNTEIIEFRKNLQEAKESIDTINSGKVDALVIADEQRLKIYTENTADRTYRILIEKMHEGAVTLNEVGTILYCNISFANMVHFPLQKVIT